MPVYGFYSSGPTLSFDRRAPDGVLRVDAFVDSMAVGEWLMEPPPSANPVFFVRVPEDGGHPDHVGKACVPTWLATPGFAVFENDQAAIEALRLANETVMAAKPPDTILTWTERLQALRAIEMDIKKEADRLQQAIFSERMTYMNAGKREYRRLLGIDQNDPRSPPKMD